MKTITKKFIAEKVVVTRGTGFNPKYAYRARINGYNFKKEFTDPNVWEDRGFVIGKAENKKEFVEAIQDFLIAKKSE